MALALWVPLAASRAAKDEIRIIRDIVNSYLKGLPGSVVAASLDRDDCPITVDTQGIPSAVSTHTARAGVPGWSPFWAQRFGRSELLIKLRETR